MRLHKLFFRKLLSVTLLMYLIILQDFRVIIEFRQGLNCKGTKDLNPLCWEEKVGEGIELSLQWTKEEKAGK